MAWSFLGNKVAIFASAKRDDTTKKFGFTRQN